MLEGNQAGLSWLTILKKRDAFREAFAGFDVATMARFTAGDSHRPMRTEGIHSQQSEDRRVKLFKNTFVFTGGEITGSFLTSIGYLAGAVESGRPARIRRTSCPAKEMTAERDARRLRAGRPLS